MTSDTEETIFDPPAWEAFLPVPGDVTMSEELMRSLDILARVMQILDIPDTSFSSFSSAISNLNTEKLTLSRTLNRLRQLEDELIDHLSALKHEKKLIEQWNKALIPGSPTSLYAENASTLEKRKEALVKKAKEYHRELEAIKKEAPLNAPVTISQLVAQKERNQAKEKELKEKRAKIKAFRGLPPNLELARHELRVARQRQLELFQLRERLLAKIADSVQ